MTLEQQIYMANRAKEVLDNEAYLKAFDDIEKELIDAWKSSPQRDVEGREKIHLSLTVLTKVRTALQTTMERGRVAADQLIYKESLLKKAKGWIGVD